MPPTLPLNLFYSYSHEDEELRNRLDKHLKLMEREGLIAPWHDRKIVPGKEWDQRIKAELERAHIILFMVSSDFMASDYIWDVEVKRAMEREAEPDVAVIPVILRPCDWHSAPFGKLQALPKDGKAITRWGNLPHDEGFLDVARGIRAVIESLTNP